MKRKVILCTFIPLGLLAFAAIFIGIVKNSKWARQKCEESVGYFSVGYEIEHSVLDGEVEKDIYENKIGIYLDDEMYIKYLVESNYIEGECIKLVISYAGNEKGEVINVTDDMQYIIVDEYEIYGEGSYSFDAHNIVDGYYWIAIKAGNDVSRASGTLRVCTYENNWNHLLNYIY